MPPPSSPQKPDALEDLEPIRRSIRSVCLRDQRTWDLSWKAVLGDSTHQSRRGIVLPDVVRETLELNGVRLTAKALASALAPFRTPSGAVNVRQWLRWIDLSRPDDHVDPELHVARLPQPFRRIHKILETDILDAAWQRIVASSARYKAELSAAASGAGSARSARSSVLNLLPAPGTELDVLELQNDYEAAKKRCCKRALDVALGGGAGSLRAVLLPTGSGSSAASWAVLLREQEEEGEEASGDAEPATHRSLVLQLQLLPLGHSKSCRVSTAVPIVSVAGRVELVTGVARELSTLDQRRLRIALLVSAEAATKWIVRVVDVLLSPDGPTPARGHDMISIASLETDEDAVSCVDLAHDGSALAVSLANKETRLFPLSASATEPLDLALATPSAVLTTDAPASTVYFLRSPCLSADASSSSTDEPPLSSIAVVAQDSLYKWRLDPVALRFVWRHLTPVACWSLDTTTQFLSLGLRDGTLVVWDLLTDRDVVVLSAPFAPAPATSVVLYGQRFLVALGVAPQELCFFDLVDRSAPLLVRAVRPLPPPASSQPEHAQPVTLEWLSPETSALDVPVVFVGYSNGYALLMDVRNGEAMGSVRSPGPPQSCWPTRDAVIVAASSASLRVFDWAALLETSFPGLPHLATQRQLPVDGTTLKRLFLASVDDSQLLSVTPAPLTLSSMAFGARPTLLSILHTTAGVGQSSSSSLPSSLASPSRAAATHGAATSSLSSLGTSASTVPVLPLGATTERRDAALPPLPSVATRAHCPTPSSLLHQFLASRQASGSGDRDHRVHRRRNELLKALTAAW
ncbi:hypothetical protein P43SY_007888 [Pythium insidiosum]|uniref:Uncharacterized protein n=1 Tax=Pythium insidiosum TaxID=114742 RepID=A0AAD5Q740_PYTIN|nr:hypothetical protein P43SY_007888 [Pythium insidiosum]